MNSIERDPAVDRLMKGLEPPPAPPELRSKVLAAARARMATEDVTDMWSTIWNRREFRLAWASAAALLLAGHVLLFPQNGLVSKQVDQTLIAENRVDEYLAEMLRPVQISADVRPIIGLFAAANGLTELELEGNPL